MSGFTCIDDAELAALRAELADAKLEAECWRALASADGHYVPFSRREAVRTRDVAKCREYAKRRDDFVRGLQEQACGKPWQPTPHDGSPEVVR